MGVGQTPEKTPENTPEQTPEKNPERPPERSPLVFPHHGARTIGVGACFPLMT